MWQRIGLGEIVEIFDGPHATPKKTDRGPVFLGISNLDSGRLDLSKTEHLSEEDYGRWTRRVTPTVGDVVFSYETRLGEAALISTSLRCCLGRRMGLLRPKGDRVDSRFLLYAFLGTQFQETLRSRTIHGSTVDRIPLNEMGSFPIEIPRSLEEQRAIAHILGTLDDKIELNRQMNQTLEAMARALFKSWFVDFDPVNAKATLKQTATSPQGGSDWSVERARTYLDRMDRGIVALFPDSFVDSLLGPIPTGWDVKALRECFNLIMGQSPPGSTYNEQGEGLPFFQGRSDFGFRYPANRKFCTAPTRMAQPGDTLVSVRAPVGDINMAWERCCIGRGVAALRHKSGTMSFSYYSTWTLQAVLREYEQTGTVFGAINKSQFEGMQVIEPSPSMVDAFDSCARPLDAKIRSNITESRTLTTLRDALLPKFISGKLRVKQIEMATP